MFSGILTEAKSKGGNFAVDIDEVISGCPVIPFWLVLILSELPFKPNFRRIMSIISWAVQVFTLLS